MGQGQLPLQRLGHQHGSHRWCFSCCQSSSSLVRKKKQAKNSYLVSVMALITLIYNLVAPQRKMCCFYFLKKNLAHCSFQKATNSESVRKKRERENKKQNKTKNKKHLISQREEFGIFPFKLCTEHMKTHFLKSGFILLALFYQLKFA